MERPTLTSVSVRSFTLLILSFALVACEGSRLQGFLSKDAPTQPAEPTDTPVATTTPTPASIPPPTEVTPLPTSASEAIRALPGAEPGPWLVGPGYGRIVALEVDRGELVRLPRWEHVDLEGDLRSGIGGAGGLIAIRTMLFGITDGQIYLQILAPPSFEPRWSIPLLEAGLAGQVSNGVWPEVLGSSPALLAVGMSGSFPTLAWSPFGRTLAFISAADGSAQLYLLDTDAEEIRKLSQGPRPPLLMGWSPGGRWLVYQTVDDLGLDGGVEFEPAQVWAAKTDEGSVALLHDSEAQFGGHEFILGWSSPSTFVSTRVDATGGMHGLLSVDLRTGDHVILYEGPILGAAADSGSGAIAFATYDPELSGESNGDESPGSTSVSSTESPALAPGIYVIPSGGTVPERIGYANWRRSYGEIRWLPEVELFFSSGERGIAFTGTGVVTEEFDQRVIPIPSPDGEWLAFLTGRGDPGVVIYTPEGEHVYEVADTWIAHLVWGADSSGFFMVPGSQNNFTNAMFFPVPYGEVTHVHHDPGFSGAPVQLISP